MPSEAPAWARAPSTLAWARYSASSACASAAVRPITGVAPTNTRIARGAARARRSRTRRPTPALLPPLTNTHSACCPANARPRSLLPAWIQHRGALRRGRDQVHRVEPVLRAAVPHAAHGGRVGEAGRVARTAPSSQLRSHRRIDGRHELVRQVVAVVMRHLPGEPHRPGRAVQVAGHDVPADPPIRELVQRGHAAGEGEGLLVGQVDGDAEAEMLRDGGHGGHQQQRVQQRHLHRVAQRRVRRAAMHVVDAQHVGQEQPVEQPALQQPSQAGPVRQRAYTRWSGPAGGSTCPAGCARRRPCRTR